MVHLRNRSELLRASQFTVKSINLQDSNETDHNNPLGILKKKDITNVQPNTQQEMINEHVQQLNKRLHAITWHMNTQDAIVVKI